MKRATNIIYLLSIIISIKGLQFRIFKGLNAPIDKYLYHAHLTASAGSRTYCGGSVIDKRWILTAAHCFNEDNIDNVRVQVGSKLRSIESAQVYYVDKRVVHDDYDKVLVRNDIALFHVTRDIEFNDKVQPVRLANQFTSISDNDNVILTGFGRLENGSSPGRLQSIVMKLSTYKICKQIERRIDQKEICTIHRDNKGPCRGDSGGPLVNENGILIGVDSHSYGECGQVPEIYIRVSSYRGWIDQKMRQHP